MGFYRLQDGLHKKMDSVRSNFLWQGTEQKFRYHMAKWEMVCRPKDLGGLGIIDTNSMNECLLVKWIWKILQEPDTLWFKILKAKYLDGCSFLSSRSKGTSQFWQGLHKVKHLFKWGAIFKDGNGVNCQFWQDCWLLQVPFKIAFENLYKMARDPFCSVADCWVDQEWYVDFRRTLSSGEFEEWESLLRLLQQVCLNDDCIDSVIWVLDKKGQFSTKSLYRFLSNRGFPSRIAGVIWKSRVLTKIKFFLWQVFNNKLQVGKTLIKRGWKGNVKCCVCNTWETIDHIFFHCVLPRFAWGICEEVFKWNSKPRSLKELSEVWLMGKGPLPKRLILFIFAGFAWALWTTRNKMSIEQKFSKTPTDQGRICQGGWRGSSPPYRG
jgi:hypothetical protein